MSMAKDTTPPKPQTPWEKFTEAARIGFNLPKNQVQKTIAKYPLPQRKVGKEKKK